MKILIVDIETTGFMPSGRIVEIGLVELDLVSGEKKIVFDKVINPGIIEDKLSMTWIVKNGYMTVEDIMGGCEFESIKKELQDVINNYTAGATAYNRRFDFDFLEHYGIRFPKKLACPMLLSTDVCCIPSPRGYGNKWPKVEEAYKFFFPESKYVELHRGADDAFHEADIVMALFKLRIFHVNNK